MISDRDRAAIDAALDAKADEIAGLRPLNDAERHLVRGALGYESRPRALPSPTPPPSEHDEADRRRRAWLSLQRSIPSDVRREILAAESCAYCPEPPEVVDHIVPVSRGGTSDRDNLAPACWICNADKSDLFLDEWVERMIERGRYPTPQLRQALALPEVTP